MKRFLKISGITLLALMLLLGAVYLVAWKSPNYYAPQTMGSYAIVPFRDYTGEHPRPFVIRRPELVLFGAAHTRNPQDSQLTLLRQCWGELRPTVALVEGRLGFLFPGLQDPVKTHGEGGLVKQLAGQDGIPVYNWDLPKEKLAAALGRQFTPPQIALAQILSPWFGQLRFGRPADEAAFLAPYLKRAANAGMQDSIRSIADIDRIWKRFFPNTDWRTVSDETRLPGFLHDMMCVTNDLRNQQLTAAIRELADKGERVFVICGSSHAFCVAPALSDDVTLLPAARLFAYGSR